VDRDSCSAADTKMADTDQATIRYLTLSFRAVFALAGGRELLANPDVRAAYLDGGISGIAPHSDAPTKNNL